MSRPAADGLIWRSAPAAWPRSISPIRRLADRRRLPTAYPLLNIVLDGARLFGTQQTTTENSIARWNVSALPALTP